jgi:hypothetical protein
VVEQLLTPQMAVEAAQAGGLALERRRGRGRALAVAGGQRGQELGDLGVPDLDRADAALLQEGPELEQVRPVGVQRVARQAPLELEIREEVEHQVLVGSGSG